MYTYADLPAGIQAELRELHQAYLAQQAEYAHTGEYYNQHELRCQQARASLEAYMLETEGHEMIHRLVDETEAAVIVALATQERAVPAHWGVGTWAGEPEGDR